MATRDNSAASRGKPPTPGTPSAPGVLRAPGAPYRSWSAGRPAPGTSASPHGCFGGPQRTGSGSPVRLCSGKYFVAFGRIARSSVTLSRSARVVRLSARRDSFSTRRRTSSSSGVSGALQRRLKPAGCVETFPDFLRAWRTRTFIVAAPIPDPQLLSYRTALDASRKGRPHQL